jgi:hypothetical protein
MYESMEDAPSSLRSILMEAINGTYCDTKEHKSAYENVVAIQNRQSSADKGKCLNMPLQTCHGKAPRSESITTLTLQV